MDQNYPATRSRHPLAAYQFSSDELRVFRECNVESFFQRSLPLGTIFGLAAYYGVKSGYIAPNVRYGPVPKVVLGVIAGYFIGKFSYQQKCAEKIMRLPNSRLGELLRQRRNTGGLSSLKPDQNLSVGLTLGSFAPSSSDVYSDEHLNPSLQGDALNLDVESRPTFAGLDDIYRPSLDSSTTTHVDSDIPIDPVKPGMTYDELRKRNREEYLKKQRNSYLSALPAETPAVKTQQEKKAAAEDVPQSKVKTNKYGDDWTD